MGSWVPAANPHPEIPKVPPPPPRDTVKPPITATSPQPPPLYNDNSFFCPQGGHCGEVQLYLYRSLAQKFFPKCLPWNPLCYLASRGFSLAGLFAL